MKNILRRLILPSAIVLLLTTCGGGPATGDTTIQGFLLRLEGSHTGSVFADSALTACTIVGATGETAGVCATPTRVNFKVGAVGLGTASGGYRTLYGSGMALGLTTAGALDVADAESTGTEVTAVGSNFESVGTGFFDRVVVQVSQIDVQVRLNNKFWNLRFAASAASPLNEQIVDDCVVDQTFRDDITAKAAASGVTHSRGDVLFCRKDNLNACTNGEYEWFDTDELLFTSTRPEFSARTEDVPSRFFTACAESARGVRGYDIDLKGVRLVAALSDPIRIEKGADGSYSYTLQSGATGSAANLRFTLSLDLTNFVQLAGITATDLSAETDESIASAATLSVFSSLFHNTTDESPLLTATPTVEVSGP